MSAASGEGVMIGIDFGTAFARAARFNPRTGAAEPLTNLDGELRTPSAVYFGRSEVLVGASAARAALNGARASVVTGVKRLLGQMTALPVPDRNLTPSGAAAELIRRIVEEAATVLCEPVRRAVLTHPPDFTATELAALDAAARKADLTEVELLAEPVAAAVGYEQTGNRTGNTVLVCDFGASRFTAAALVRTEDGSFRPAAPARTRRVGGDDFDRFLFGLCDRAARERHQRPLPSSAEDPAGLTAARECKEELSHRSEVEFAARFADGATFRCPVTRAAFDELIRAEVEGLARLARAAFDEAAEHHPPAETVLLVGGSSRVPLVRAALTAALPVGPTWWPQQDLAVALGAGRIAFARWGSNGPAPRVRVERTTTLSELIHRVSEHEAKEKARMAGEHEQRRAGTRKRVLDVFATKAAALDREYEHLRTQLADRMANRDYPRVQEIVCAMRKLRTDDPEVTKAQAFLDTRCDKIGEVRSISVGTYVFGVALTTDGKFAWLGISDNRRSHSTALCDLTAGTVVKNLSGHSGVVASTSINRSQKQVASGSHDGTIRLWNAAQHTEIASWNHGGVVRSVAFLPDDKHLAAVGDDNKVRLWNTEATAAPVVTFEGHTATVHSVHPAPDGKFLASASDDGTVRVWDIERGRETRKLTGHKGAVYCTRFFPGGRLVVSGGQDHTLRIWDTESGREMGRWEGHGGPVKCVDFTPDGRYAVSAGDDRTVRVWDVASGWELRKFTGHGDVIGCVAVSADGKHAVTGSSDSTLRLWVLGLNE